MAFMRHFTFNVLLLLQRADAALADELRRRVPDRLALVLLRRRRRQLAARLRRSLSAPLAAGV
jgi:hypothetical protein